MWYDLNYPSPQPITTIDINERVIAYGDGFFSTMAVVFGTINWLDYHQQRCQIACENLQLDMNLPLIYQHLTTLANQIQHGMLKIVVCRQSQAVRGYGFDNCLTNVWAKLMPSPTLLANRPNEIILQPTAQAVCLRQKIAVLPPNLAGLKLLNAQDKVFAHHELLQRQQQNPKLLDGLVQDMFGNWVEGSFCNIFYQLNHQNQWFTPNIEHSGVNGVMRQVLLDKLGSQRSQQRNLGDKDLANISALFFCNAVRGVIPIDSVILPDGTVKNLSIVNILID
ncbi:aminotransferase class IV [Faucicola mancuniensis]|uniref:aminotransferase class IV n=1 Tax=Faucicola mancuniensis TaxID=1309795 RepID=UPI0028EE05E5|nr:aminotransferase class IV [uncultured Moraxella sp.]